MDMEAMRRHLRALEVDAASHRPREEESDEEYSEGCTGERQQDPTAEAVVARYEDALRQLEKDVEQLKNKITELSHAERQSTLREVIPELTHSLSAHTAKHYWTSPTSRQLAKGVIEKLLNLCGCRSTLELLIGHLGSHDSGTVSRDSHVTSPYIPMATAAEPTTASPRVSDSTSDHESDSTCYNYSKEGGSEAEIDVCEHSRREKKTEMLFSGGIIKSLLSLLRSRLTKETWKRQPNAKHALVWTLRQLKHPHLSPYFPSFFPPLLMLLDDHESYHKVLGLTAMTHLIKNMDPSELRWYGRAEVIYEAIKSMLYIREVSIIHALHDCLVILLPVLEGPPPITVTAPRKPTQTDDVFRILLNNLDFESKIALRKAYIAHLSNYMKLLGIYTARHMKQVLKVTAECLKYPDYSGEETRQSALKSLLTLMKHTWPRIPYHRDVILKMLLKLVSDLCPEDDHIPEKSEIRVQLKLISECMLTLHHCCGNIEDLYRTLLRDCAHSGLVSCLETSLAGIEPRQS